MRTHVRLAMFLVTAVATAQTQAATPASPGADKSCTLNQYASLKLTTDEFGRILVPVELEGKMTSMTLSMSSAFSGIYDAALKQFSLKTSNLDPSAIVQYGGKRIDRYANVTSMSLGNARWSRSELLVVPIDRPKTSVGDMPLVGFIGTDLFRKIDVELDLGHNEMRLFGPYACAGIPVYWADEYNVVPMRRGQLNDLYFVMELDGKKLQAKLATGSDTSKLYTNVTKKLYGWDEHSSGVETVEDPRGGSRTQYRAMALTAGGLSIVNAKIALYPPTGCLQSAVIASDHDGAAGFDYHCMGAYPLGLGMNVLAKLRLYLASKQGKLYFTPWNAHKDTAPAGLAPAVPAPGH